MHVANGTFKAEYVWIDEEDGDNTFLFFFFLLICYGEHLQSSLYLRRLIASRRRGARERTTHERLKL
jgi:hypothetical protein